MEEGQFDSVYQPIRNALGEISGIMIQTTDVTQQVLARAVPGTKGFCKSVPYIQPSTGDSSLDLPLSRTHRGPMVNR